MGIFNNLVNWFKGTRTPKKLTLGLALGSGGAKGFAELGILKAFEENGIEFDVVAGTSIGSILGAFYADGYSTTDIYNFLSKIDYGEIKSLIMIKMDTVGLYNVIDRFIGGKNIEELKKPFRAIATEIETGEGRVFSSGSVALTLCASSCMPPFFKPVVIDNERYIDGAFVNSVPADQCREMGADYVVGVDLADHDPKPGGMLSKLFPTYESKVKEPWTIGYQNSDIVIHPPELVNYKAISFNQADEMYEIGYKNAMAVMPKIKEDIEKLRKKIKR